MHHFLGRNRGLQRGSGEGEDSRAESYKFVNSQASLAATALCFWLLKRDEEAYSGQLLWCTGAQLWCYAVASYAGCLVCEVAGYARLIYV